MSYHGANAGCGSTAGPGRDRLTERQLDRWTAALDSVRVDVRDGGTILLYPFATWPYDGSIAHPFASVQQAMNESGFTGNDFFLFRPGIYDIGAHIVINQPVTLRATREGTARIGG